jgi:copper chaperone CopZ
MESLEMTTDPRGRRRARRRSRLRAAIAILVGCLAPHGAARARVLEVVVPVSGMTCALCTRGVEESIRRLRGVETARADLASGRVRVTAAREHPLTLDEVKRSVKEAGFGVAGECDVIAGGRFTLGEEGRMLFAVRDTAQRYRVLENNQTLDLFRAHPGLEGEFTVRFRLHRDGRWVPPAISILSFEGPGGAR